MSSLKPRLSEAEVRNWIKNTWASCNYWGERCAEELEDRFWEGSYREISTHNCPLTLEARSFVLVDTEPVDLRWEEEVNLYDEAVGPSRILPMARPIETIEDWHGTRSGYAHHRCRCRNCRAAYRPPKKIVDAGEDGSMLTP